MADNADDADEDDREHQDDNDADNEENGGGEGGDEWAAAAMNFHIIANYQIHLVPRWTHKTSLFFVLPRTLMCLLYYTLGNKTFGSFDFSSLY